MKKRLLVLLMALAMCFAMFGCGNEEAAPEEGTDEPTVTEPAEGEEGEATPEDGEQTPEDGEATPDTEATPE